MKNRNKKAIIAFSVFIVIILLIISIVNNKKISKYDKVATFKISLKDTTLKEINNNSKEIKYKNNNLKVEYDGKTLVNQNITMKGRGNTSWYYIKKSYQITFDEEIDLFNLGKAEKWVLTSNYSDETLIRNHLAFYIGNKLNMPYTYTGINVDLYVDDEYLGLYYLTPKIAINEASVNLKNKDGIVVELDNNYYFEEDEYYTSEYNEDHFLVKDVKEKTLKDKAINNFMDDYNALYKALNSKDWESVNKLIDVESFAKYYIVNELSKNGDSYSSSFYMYQDGKNDKIHAGPIWDFDLAFYNDMIFKDYFIFDTNKENDRVVIPAGLKHYYPSEVITKLLEFDEFKEKIKTIWNKELKDNLEDILEEVDKEYFIIKDNATKDIEKYNFPNTYDETIKSFKEILKTLYEDFNNNIKENF